MKTVVTEKRSMAAWGWMERGRNGLQRDVRKFGGVICSLS